MKKDIKKSSRVSCILISVLLLMIGFIGILPESEAASVQVLYDDFEDANMNEWNYSAGSGEVANIGYAGNYSAQLDNTMAAFQNYTSDSEVMVNAWVYLDESGGAQLLRMRRINLSDSSDYITVGLEWNDSSNYVDSLGLVTFHAKGGGSVYYNMSIKPSLRTWFNLGFWSDGNRVRVFYNGSLVLDITNSTPLNFNQLIIGTTTPSGRFPNPNQYLLDELYVWTGSPANYRAGGMQSGLKAAWISASHGGHPYANGTAEIIGGAKTEAGVGAPFSIPNRVAKNYTIADMFWGGERTDITKARFQTDCIDLNPDIAILMLGPNDYPVFPSSTTIANIKNMTDWALSLGISVILVEPPPLKEGGNSSHKPKINDTVDFVRQYANNTDNVFLCSIFEFFRDDNYTLNATYRAPDNVHFNILGLEKMAQFVEMAIQNATPFVPPPPPPPPITLEEKFMQIAALIFVFGIVIAVVSVIKRIE